MNKNTLRACRDILRRRSGRRPTGNFGMWNDRGQCVGHSRDLSPSGVFFETTMRPAIGSELDVTLINDSDESQNCSAWVVRHDLDGIGLTFARPNLPFRNALGRVLHHTN